MRPTLFAVALFFSAASNAKPLQALKRQSEPAISGYDYVGCYTDSTSNRALTGSVFFDDAMTVEKCAAACSAFTWFGVEYGRECYCGNSVNAGSVGASGTDCAFLCPGDASEFCGAGDRLNLYSMTTATSAAAAASSYTFQGCYNDPAGTGNPRAISNYVYYDDEMTAEKCQTACAGYTYFGIEYNRECYCGNALTAGTTQASASPCDTYMCNGDTTQSCGGNWQLDLYELVPIAVTTTTSSTSTSSTLTSLSTTSSAASTATGTAFQGCYNEPPNVRALTDHVYYDDDMTVEKCGTACDGFLYFGIEYGRECYCGNALTVGTTQASPDYCDTFMCVGDSTESCGGNWQLDLYQTSVAPAASSYASQGCYTEATSERALSDAVYYDDAMTVEKCAVYCASGQYAWFGVEYGRECYCGNTINAGSVPAPTSDCSFQCPGDSSESCGAGNRLDMYQYGTTATTTTTTTSTSSSTTSTFSTTSTTTATSSISTTMADSTTSTTSSASTSSTTSSTTSTTSASTTASNVPSCATPLADPGFEETDPSAVPWTVQFTNPSLVTYNFMDTNTATGPIHGGAQQASINYRAVNTNFQTWFNQPITVCPNTLYKLSAWSRGSGSGICNVYWSIWSADSTTAIKSMAIASARSSSWVQSTGTWQSGTTVDVTFNIQIDCTPDSSSSRSYYMDDISFVAAS